MTIQHFRRTLYGSVLFAALTVPVLLLAQQNQQTGAKAQFPRYTVEDLGTLGGPYSFTYSMNDLGVVTGGSATTSQNGDATQALNNAPQTAFFWTRGRIHSLGMLGGSSSVGAAANLFGLSVVDSETASPSRHGEDVCGFGDFRQCSAAIEIGGHMAPLPFLPGGNNSYALDVNDFGQVVGFSDTGVYDRDCAAARTAGYQFQAVVWGPRQGVRRLTPLKNDSVAFPFGINNSGEVVGGSGNCADTTPPPYPGASHAVLWKRDGTPVNLGNLGGPVAVASAINSRGDVSGTSATADGLTRPFLWTPQSGKLQKLEPPAGYPIAINPCCKSINDSREIVGFMLDANFNSRPFFWKNGAMVDLNELLPENSPWTLQSAVSINKSSQIAGQGLINGQVHAFLATPCHRHPGRPDYCCEANDH